MSPKDADVPISAGTCGQLRTNCRNWNIGIISLLMLIVCGIIAATWTGLGKTQDAVASLQQETAGQKATLQSIKENTDEMKRYLMQREFNRR